MKKILLFIGLIAASLSTFAQKSSFGIKGGIAFPELQISDQSSNLSITTGSVTSFSIGVLGDCPLKGSNFSVQPGVYFTGRGGKITGDGNSSGTFNLYYAQLPLDFVYHAKIEPGNIFIGAGPYIAIGISGKVKVDDGQGNTISEDASFGSNGNFKTADAGIQGIAGLQLKKGFLIGINYDLGLTNIAQNSGSGAIKNRVFGISIGFLH
jgi:hypothetical protein